MSPCFCHGVIKHIFLDSFISSTYVSEILEQSYTYLLSSPITSSSKFVALSMCYFINVCIQHGQNVVLTLSLFGRAQRPAALFDTLNVPGGLFQPSLYVPGPLSVHVTVSFRLCVCLSVSRLKGF